MFMYLSTEARVGGGCPAMLSAYHNTIEHLYVTLGLCILSTEARVGGGCPTMLSAYHDTKRNLCNVTFMYFINRGKSWWWLSHDVISLA